MNSCCINRLSEVTCPTPTGKAIWFKCRYSACHGGVGHVTIKASDGSAVYDGYPTSSTSKYVYIDFDTSKINALGGTMDVTYKPGDSNWGSHACNRATFDWGYASSEQLVVGTAHLDNTGGSNDLGNGCAGVGGIYSRCNTFTIPAGAFAPQSTTTPTGFYAKTRKICFVGTQACSNWIEAISNAVPVFAFAPVGYKFATLPAGKTFFIALINYNTRGVANTSAGAELKVTHAGTVLATYPLNLQSNGSPLSPFPFDGTSIDGTPFAITNTWGHPVEIEAAGGTTGSPGISFDDSVAYQIA